MAIRPKTVTKARGVGTAQAVRESDSNLLQQRINTSASMLPRRRPA